MDGFTVDGSILGAVTDVDVVDGPIVDSVPPQPAAGKITSPKTIPRNEHPDLRMRSPSD
jgi:hypothetical protein